MHTIRNSLLLLSLTFILQGCSWIHVFQIQNKTEKTWTVSYTLDDPRGILSTQIAIQRKGSKEHEQIKFESNEITFSLAPNEIAHIGMARNAHYKGYKKISQFDAEIPWKTFLNTASITFSNQQVERTVPASDLLGLLSKNSKGIARIELGKLR